MSLIPPPGCDNPNAQGRRGQATPDEVLTHEGRGPLPRSSWGESKGTPYATSVSHAQ